MDDYDDIDDEASELMGRLSKWLYSERPPAPDVMTSLVIERVPKTRPVKPPVPKYEAAILTQEINPNSPNAGRINVPIIAFARVTTERAGQYEEPKYSAPSTAPEIKSVSVEPVRTEKQTTRPEKTTVPATTTKPSRNDADPFAPRFFDYDANDAFNGTDIYDFKKVRDDLRKESDDRVSPYVD